MSRIGRKPIAVPSGVEVTINGPHVKVKGPQGVLENTFHKSMTIGLEDSVLTVTRPSDSKRHKALHGLTRALLKNMVTGVSDGFSKVLDIVGVGYSAKLEDNKLVLDLGYSHPIVYEPAEGVEMEVPVPTRIVVKGIDRQKVGQAAAEIRGFRPPEPYKGKGVRYHDEEVRKKAGKAAVGVGA
jgi:large subunit ribosomal protein L6